MVAQSKPLDPTVNLNLVDKGMATMNLGRVCGANDIASQSAKIAIEKGLEQKKMQWMTYSLPQMKTNAEFKKHGQLGSLQQWKPPPRDKLLRSATGRRLRRIFIESLTQAYNKLVQPLVGANINHVANPIQTYCDAFRLKMPYEHKKSSPNPVPQAVLSEDEMCEELQNAMLRNESTASRHNAADADDDIQLIPKKEFNLEHIQSAANAWNLELFQLGAHCVKHNLSEHQFTVGRCNVRAALDRLVKQVDCAHSLLSSFAQLRLNTDAKNAPKGIPLLQTSTSKLQKEVRDGQEQKKENLPPIFRRLFVYFQEILASRDLRLDGIHVLREKYLRPSATQTTGVEPVGTNYWEAIGTLEEFFNNNLDFAGNEHLYVGYWSNNNLRKALVDCFQNSMHIPGVERIQPSPHVVAFKSHLYYKPLDMYWKHTDINKPSHLVASVYFDCELDTRELESIFDYFQDADGKDTPLTQLFKDQGYSPQELVAACFALARMLYPFDYDGREVLTYLKGIGGSGKSAILKFLQQCFSPRDIGYIATHSEQVFGLQSFLGKKIIFGMDTTRHCDLDLGAVLAIVSGDPTNVKIKHVGGGQHMVLPCHLIFAGNEYPDGWTDSSGNLMRRFFVLDFPNVPPRPDITFKTRLIKSAGTSYRFLNLAFLLANTYLPPSANVLENMPDRFVANRTQFLAEQNPVGQYLVETKDTVWFIQPDKTCTYEEFDMRYRRWASDNGLRQINFLQARVCQSLKAFNRSLDVTPAAEKTKAMIIGLGLRPLPPSAGPDIASTMTDA